MMGSVGARRRVSALRTVSLHDAASTEQASTAACGRRQSAEKPRKNPHYLKGSIYCGECGHVLGIEIVRNRQGFLYPYFYCLGRQKRRTNCGQKAIMVDVVEQQIADYWRTVTLPGSQIEAIRHLVQQHIDYIMPRRQTELEQARATVAALDAQRQKLLQAHYNDAIPLDLLKQEQARIGAQMAAAIEVVHAEQLTKGDLRRS